jgi:hydroxyacylglutathione hydrolase
VSNAARPQVVRIPLGTGGMVNAYLVVGERAVLVDTGLPGDGPAIAGTIERAGVRLREVALIVLTHTHVDHAGSAADLREKTGAPVAVPRAELTRVQTGQMPPTPTPSGFRGRLILKFFGSYPPTIPAFEPEIVHDGALDLSGYGVVGRLVPTPGHSPGHVVIALEGGDVIAGDALSGGLVVRRAPMLPYFAEDLPGTVRSARVVAGLALGTVYVGHGGPLRGGAVRRAFGNSPA